MRRLLRAAALVALAAIPLLSAVPAVAADASNTYLYAVLGTCHVTVYANVGHELDFHLVDPQGVIRSTVTVTHIDSQTSICFEGERMSGGDRVLAIENGTKIDAVVLPRLRVTVDRDTDVVAGRGPAGLDLEMGVNHCDASGVCKTVVHHFLTVPSSGHWSLGVSGELDITGVDAASVIVKDADGDQVSLRRQAPSIDATIGSRRVDGFGDPGERVTVTVKGPGGVLKASGSARVGIDGRFSVPVRRDGKAVRLAEDDRVLTSLAEDASLKLHLRLSVLPSDDAVLGECFAQRPFQLWRIGVDGIGTGHAGVSAADGRFGWGQAGLGEPGALRIDARCTSAAGDQVHRSTPID